MPRIAMKASTHMKIVLAVRQDVELRAADVLVEPVGMLLEANGVFGTVEDECGQSERLRLKQSSQD